MVEIEETGILLSNLTVSNNSPLVVVGIPAFNEEKTIAHVIIEAQKHSDVVIVCDDGSSDLTGAIAERMGAVVIRHNKNLGYGAALQSLFRRARDLKADVLVTLDSDGQHDPSQIPLLVKPIETGVAEVVLGSRFMDKDGSAEMPLYRQFGVKVITKLTNGSGNVSDAQSGFRAYSKLAIENLSMSENGMSASIELLREISKSGLKVHEVPITCKYSSSLEVDTSTKHPFVHGISLLVALTKLVVEDRPLLFLGLPGIICVSIGSLFGVWMLNMYAILHEIVTNLALASVSFILIGCFMISTAITLYAIKRLSEKVTIKA